MGYRRGGAVDLFSGRVNSADRVDPDQSASVGVEGKTAPGPFPGVIEQFSFERIHGHVVRLLDSLLQTPDVEVVKSALPETRQRNFGAGEDEFQLTGGRPPLAAQAARDALFQDLNNGGRRPLERLGDE